MYVQIMRQLLDKGAPIDAKTADGDTPLSLAVSAGAVGSVGFLVKAGAALDLEDKVTVPLTVPLFLLEVVSSSLLLLLLLLCFPFCCCCVCRS